MKAFRKSSSDRIAGMPILFPERVVKYIHEELRKYSGEELPHLKDLTESKDSVKQLSILREISTKFGSYKSEHWNLLANVLISGLFHCSGNSALSSAITETIGSIPEREMHLFASVFKSELELCKMIDAVRVIAGLVHCNTGQKLVSSDLTSILYLKNALKQYLKNLKETSSTMETATFFKDLHITIRTILSLICICKEGTEDLIELIISFLNHSDIPLDVGGNCAKILILLLAAQDHGIQQIVSRLSSGEAESHLYGVLAHLDVSLNTTLSVCSALLSTLKLQTLQSNIANGTLMGNFILANILKSSSNQHNTLVAILRARCLESWLQRGLEMVKCLELKNIFMKDWNLFKDQLLELIFNSMEHQVDVVRYSAKEAFQNFLQIHLLVNGDSKQLLEQVLHLPRLKKSKYMALSCISQSLLVSRLLEMEPDLADELLDAAKDPSLCNHAKDAFNTLMTSDASGFDTCIRPLLDAIGEHPQSQSFETCFTGLLKRQPSLLNNVLDWYLEDKTRLRVYIIVLLAARKLGLLETPSEPELNSWNEVTPNEVLVAALEHSDDKIRLNALALIVEGPKTNQLFSRLELQHLKRFVEVNMGNPSAAFRQQMTSSIKKLLLKLRDGGTSLRRRPEERWRTELYSEWVQWLVALCLDHLAPDSNFSRRFLALQLLQSAFKIYESTRIPDVGSTASLVDCLFDSFEANQQTALGILQEPFLRDYCGGQGALVQFYPESAASLAKSIRPADSSAASFLFRWIAHWPVQVGQDHPCCPIRKEWTLVTANTLRLTIQLTTLLRERLNLARQQIGPCGALRQLVPVPVYGLVASIRSLLADQETRSDEMDVEPWKQLTSDIVDLCFGCSRLAAPVVTDESPEGFLPADALSSADRAGCDSQSLLVSAWRTVKEVSLLFGRMAGWILSPHLSPLLEQSTVVDLGTHLKQLLLDTKHRGAFEQVHCGFSQLCDALWRCADEKLHRLPVEWLRRLLRDLRSAETAAKLCRTRRSAGLPFMIQAILGPPAELSARPEVLDEALNELLDIASGSEAECRLHGLNILRMLFRDARLGQLIGPYVARGLVLAIDGFEAPLWPERNASTLLFSALMTRVFGVPRSKTDVQKRNALTGRVFFRMYPQLHSYLLERLQRCTSTLDSGLDLHPALFPVLLLLTRLQAPSGADLSPSPLEPFVPLVQACAASSVLKTRQLAAQALIPLLTPEASTGLLLQLLERISTLEKHNEIHGTLLQIHSLITERPSLLRMPEFCSQMECLVCLANSGCDIIRYEFLRIMEVVRKNLSPESQENLFELCLEQISSPSAGNPEPFRPLYLRQAVRICGLLKPESQDLTSLLCHPLHEIRQELMELANNNLIRPDLSRSAENLVAVAIGGDHLALSLLTRKPLIDNSWIPDRQNLEWALELFRNVPNDSARCAALLAASKLIGCAERTQDPKLLLQWAEYLMEVEDPESSPQFRTVCAESLYICHRMLGQPLCGILASKLWICLFRCLTDDDESVRNCGAKTVDKLMDRFSPTHASIAVEMAGDFFVERIASAHPVEAILALLHLSFDSGTSSPSAESNAFEKGDSDSSGEPLIRSLFYAKLLRSVVQNPPKSFNPETVRLLVQSLTDRQLFQNSIPLTTAELVTVLLEHQFDYVDVDVNADDIHQRRSVIDLSIGLSQLVLVAGALIPLGSPLVEFRRRAADALRRRIPPHVAVRSVNNIIDV